MLARVCVCVIWINLYMHGVALNCVRLRSCARGLMCVAAFAHDCVCVCTCVCRVFFLTLPGFCLLMRVCSCDSNLADMLACLCVCVLRLFECVHVVLVSVRKRTRAQRQVGFGEAAPIAAGA